MISKDAMCASFAAAVRDGLKRNSLTKKELAEITMLSKRTIMLMANGRSLPNLYNAYLISDVLGMSLDEMIRYKLEV